MKKLITLVCIATAILGTFIQGVEQRNGMIGYTNSPSESNCRSCHSSFALNTGGGSIASSSTDMTSWIYTPGTTYSMTVTVSKASVTLFGVDVEILDSTGANAGTITVTDATKTQVANVTVGGKSRTNLTHRTGGGASTTGAATFNFSWTAPATSVGNVTMFYTGIASNANNSDNGDYVYSGSQIFTPEAVIPNSIENIQVLHGLSVNPMPIVNDLNISFYSNTAAASSAEIFDMNGRVVANLFNNTSTVGLNNITVDKPSQLTSGIYFLHLMVGNSNKTVKIIVQ